MLNRPSTPEIKCKKPHVTRAYSVGQRRSGHPWGPRHSVGTPGRLEPDLGTGETAEELTDGQQVWGPPETAGDFPSLLPHHWADLRLPRAPAAAPTSPQLRAGLHEALWTRKPSSHRARQQQRGTGRGGQARRPDPPSPSLPPRPLWAQSSLTCGPSRLQTPHFQK